MTYEELRERLDTLLENLDDVQPSTDLEAYVLRDLANQLAECRNMATALENSQNGK
jgi:hypothetical protein